MLTPLLLRACVTGSLSVINIAGYYKQYVCMYSVHIYGFPQGLCTVRTVYICTYVVHCTDSYVCMYVCVYARQCVWHISLWCDKLMEHICSEMEQVQ